ncbi:MAG: transposase [Betaproteobacteria bacterium]|jgi:transposase|uniref:transposase n=1 Tax=Silanimonas sp. TaxID=1929290 RepID=UPI0022C30664|nr:transposase [Silanimonas sp.]MCZ8167291.1 transposase [Silanimonas sp.]
MASKSGQTRRRYRSQFKAMVLPQCDEPGMSVAKVAMSHGIDDNVVHRWLQLERHGGLRRCPASLWRGRPS